MNNQTNEAATSNATTTDERVAQVHGHIRGLLEAMMGLETKRQASVFREILVLTSPGVFSALSEDMLNDRHSVSAQIAWLQEIEQAAMDLLDVAPDYDDDENGNEIATAATRIFSRVRFILPREHEARHREEAEDEGDAGEAAADEPSGTRSALNFDDSDGAESAVAP